MPVRGGRVQKRVNEGGQNFNFDGRNSNLGLSVRHPYGLFAAAGLDPPPGLEELDELEALLEREQELLGQHQISPASINFLHSPGRRSRPPIESPHRRGHTPRTIPRTYGCNSVPLNQLSSIIFNMTFSDAEEDHQGTRDGRERTTSGGNEGGNSDRERSTSRSRTESGVSNASTVSLASPPSAPPPPPPPVNGEVDGPSTSSGGASSSTVGASGSLATALSANNDDLASKLMDIKGVDSKKIMEKLQQIQGYIRQTSTAMESLEQQGDLGNIGQYNTLAKVMRDLKDSETKLQGHLDAALKSEGAAAQVANGAHNEVSESLPPTNGVDEPTPAVSESTGNQIVGIVHPSNVQGLSLQERLVASQVESSAIITRMRDSIARREDLMTRYKATRERLENLKKQRQDMRQEQRRLQDTVSGNDSSYEDPVPGAETWSNEDIATSIVEFQTLFDKVARIQDMYTVKAQTIDPDDEEAQAHVANKMEQVTGKRRQLIDALTKLRLIQRQREMDELTDAGDAPPNSQPSAPTPAATNPAPTPSESDGNRSAVSEQLSVNDSALVVGSGSQPGGHEEDNRDGVGTTMARVSRITEEVASKQTELANLQKQFNDMKKLLDVTTEARLEDERRMIASKKRLEDAEALVAETRRTAAASAEIRRTAEASAEIRRTVASVEGALGEEVITVSGRRIQLSEAEKQNPAVMSRYQDLAKAKERLAKMEEVMSMISTAKNNRQDLREVLPPEYLALLEDAENEYPDVNRTRRQPAEVSIIEEESEDDLRSARRYQRSSRRGSASRGEPSTSAGRNEHDRYAREQESREISAMQKRLNKTTSRVSAVNEGSRHGTEKGAIKKQPQALWQERNPNIDPRMTEVMALQEELKQKKNALEALMKRMGKSTSLNLDNISDNISDNVSDNASDRVDGGTTATWGTGALHDYSDNHYHQSSDDELVEPDETEILQRSHRRSQPPPSSSQPKDRNRYSGTSRHRRRQDSGHFSVNNLATAPTGRPKHNRFRGGSVPKATWESVPKSPSNTTLQAQQSIGAALSQLTQVQGTINNLHETLRHEQNQMMGPPNLHAQIVPQLLPELPTPSLPSSSMSHIPGVGAQPLTPMTAYAGLGSLSLGASESSSPQMVSLLQQCVSQLQLHSLEIQALSKHLQLLDRRDVGGSAPISDTGGGRMGRGGGGGGGARRSEEEEEEEEEDEEDDEDVTTGTHPSYALHHNLLGAPLSQEERESVSQVPMNHSFPVYLGQAGDEGHSTGVTNPIYGRLGDIRDQARPWSSHDPTSGIEQTADHMAALIGVSGVMENSPSHPLLHLDRMSEERPQSQPQPPEDHHWASLASSHPLHHQTTDLLNNQVPPGTRANNYWDNFRSYSRQNLLSTATKSNTSEHRPSSCTSAAAGSGVVTRHQAGEGGQMEDKRFNVSHNNNSSVAGGARARVSNPRLNNPKGARVRNAVSSNRQQAHIQNKHKTNNRMKQGDWYSHGSAMNIPAGNTPQAAPSSGISHDRSLVNYNSTRGNSSDSDGGIGGVTLEVLREAESLMRCHANQPEFLLQLFRHASQITVHTDQHVAVALLQDLAARPHRTNHGVNANNQGHINESSSLSLPAPLRESSWRRASSRSDRHNILPQENGSVGGLSGSEVSDSGLTSDDEDNRASYRNEKNLSLSPGMPGTMPWASAANTGAHPRPQYPPSPQQCHPHFPHHNSPYFPQQQNLSNNQGSSRSVANSESSVYDRLIYNESHLGNDIPQEADERWLNQETADHRVRKAQNEPDTAGSSPEHAPHITHPLSNDTEFLSFESLVASAVRASVELLQTHAGSMITPANTVTPLLLSAIHNTVVGQVQTQAQSLNLPQSFLVAVDTELKAALQAFVGKRLMEVSNEVPSVISQVLLTQYCTVLVQRLRDNHPALPQTPTKLPQNKQTQMSEKSGDTTASAAASSSAVTHVRPPQENTTSTQTESSVFSIMPHQHSGLSSSTDPTQRPSHHAAHPVSMISVASGVSHNSSLIPSHAASHPSVHSSTHSSSPHPSPHITNSLFQSSCGSGQWQAPFTVPAPSPSGPSTLSESGQDSSANILPTSQPEAWAASSLISQVTESPLSLSRPESRSTVNTNQASSGAGQDWGKPEHEEAVMDDLAEPLLPVYDLAEADQSQDAGDAAEGDWEDSQAEGIQADGPSTIDESPEHPIRLQAEVEGMAESEADAAEVSNRGAMGHLLYGDHLVQGAARELGLDEVPTKLQSPDSGSPGGTPEHHSGMPQGHHSSTPEGHHHPTGPSHTSQPSHSPGGEG